MSYIEREAAICIADYAVDEHPYEKNPKKPETFSAYNAGWDDACDYIRSRLETEQCADVAPVVRCRECKHHEDEEIGIVYCPNAIGGWVGEDWFCADGERKDGAE